MRPSFNVYADVDNRERARARDKKGELFSEKQQENFFISCEKMRNASGQQGAANEVKMNASGKKKRRKKVKRKTSTKNKIFGEHIHFFFHKMCDWKVLRGGRAKQRQRNV